MLLMCPSVVSFPVSFAKASLNSTWSQIYFLSVFWTRFGCTSQYALAVRNPEQAEQNTRRLHWFDFSCARGFLVSFVPMKSSSLRREREPLPHGPGGRGGWRCLSAVIALPIYRSQEQRLGCTSSLPAPPQPRVAGPNRGLGRAGSGSAEPQGGGERALKSEHF